MRRKFIVNPTARNGSIRRELPALSRCLIDRLGIFDHAVTESWQSTRDETRRALHEGADQIIVVGGDGTANAAVNGFFDGDHAICEQALLVISNCGTGSDYFKTIARDESDWTKLVMDFEPRPVDIGRIELLDPNNGELQSRYFLNMASIGMSARVASLKLRLPFSIAAPSSLSYFVPAIRCLLFDQPYRARISLEGEKFDGKFMNLFAAKGEFAGGGVRVGGGVLPDDGKLDVTLIEAMHLIESLPRFYRLYAEGLRPEKKVLRKPSSWVEVSSPELLPIELDGEVQHTREARLSIKPRAVRVCFPKKISYT